jgi:hypothetical protein
MQEVNLVIIQELKNFLSYVSDNKLLLRRFAYSDKDFTRRRTLTFEKLVLLIAKLCKKTLSVEINLFFEELQSGTTCTVSAFVQQRGEYKVDCVNGWI